MLGNLSKILIKAPPYFNNNIDKKFSKKTKENILDTYSKMHLVNKGRANNMRYFKERDFIQKCMNFDINFNNNYRKELTPTVKTRQCISFEEFMFGNSNIPSSNNTANNTKQSLYKTNESKSYINAKETFKSNKTKNSSSSHATSREKFKNYIQKELIQRDSIEEFNSQIKSNLIKLIDKINHNSLKISPFDKSRENNGKSRIENLKDFINKDTVVETPVKVKFPEIFIQTQDNLYRDAMDKKLKSLSLVSPKIKEQLETKNRATASRRDFYRYNMAYSTHQRNPFYESVKYLEDNQKNC